MRLLTFTRYQKNNILYTPIEGVIAILKIAITLPKTKNHKTCLTDEVMILYKKKKSSRSKLRYLKVAIQSINLTSYSRKIMR